MTEASEPPLGNKPAAAADLEAAFNTKPQVRYLPVLEALIVGMAAGLSAVILLSGIRLVGSWRLAMSLQ